MSAFVERLAKLLAQRHVYYGYNEETKARIVAVNFHHYQEDVRAILSEMREAATEEMLFAMAEGEATDKEPIRWWQAALDVALEEEKP